MTFSRNSKNLLAYSLPLALVGLAAFAFLLPYANDDAHVALALRLTAWLAFLVYVVIFVARPLRQLLPNPFTMSLLRNRPYVGLGLAAVMTVHLALIGWRFIFVLGERPGLPELLAGGVAYTLLFLMAITTFPAPARALGPRNWRRLHKTGLYVIGLVYFNSLIGDVFAKPADPVYLTIGVLIAFAIAVRLAAFVKLRYQRTAAIASDR